MKAVSEQFGVILLSAVLILVIGAMWIFRADHDVKMAIEVWGGNIVGGILTLIVGKASQAQQSNISNSQVKQIVESPHPSTEVISNVNPTSADPNKPAV
jgi:hypothetical protein